MTVPTPLGLSRPPSSPPAGEVRSVSRTCLTVACLLLGSLPAARAEAPSFVNDVSPILTRYGCNQGACHGKGTGQNGFRLSLRGYAPDLDHASLTREFSARRLSFADPESSALLRKATGQAAHEGGKLLAKGGRAYETLLAWVRAGAPGPQKDDAKLTALTVQPAGINARPGARQPLRVEAAFSDGATRDVTWLCKFESNDAGTVE